MPGPIINSPINLGIPVTPDGIPKEMITEIQNLYNALRVLQTAFQTYCGIQAFDTDIWNQLSILDTVRTHNLNRLYLPASENIVGGAMVHVFDSGAGVMKFRNANATDNSRQANGFLNVSGGILTGSYGEVILGSGLCPLITGMTPGGRYFLSTTNGLIVNLEPVAAGNIGQYIGYALGASLLYVDINMQWIQH